MKRLTVITSMLTLLTTGCLLHPPVATVHVSSETRAQPEVVEGEPPEVAHGGDRFVCEDNNEMTLSNRTLHVNGDAVVVAGNCELVITNCTIFASGTAIRVMDNGNVKVANSTIEGSTMAITIDGNGEVHASNSMISGPIVKHGNGDFLDEGGNTIQ